MKNKYIALAFAAGLSLTACDDTLEVSFPSNQDPALTFSNVEDATMAINGVYVKFCEDPFTSRMSNVWMQNTDVETQSPNSGRPSGGHRSDIWGLQASADVSFSDIYKAWNNCLEAIDLANQIIDGISESGIKNEAEMQQILGEAICLKSWRYLMMCNFWGDVPFYNEPAAYGQELDKPRTDKHIIYSSCLQQLVDIEPNMKFSDANTGGIERMNRDFCMGLIAKIALFRAGYGMTAEGTMKKADDYLDYQNDPQLAVTYTDMEGNAKVARSCADYYEMAKDYCQKLIELKGRALNSNYSEAFDNQVSRIVKNNAEVLFEVAFLEGKGGDVGWCIGVTNTNSKASNGTTTNQVGINPIYYMSFAENDVRRDATCSRYSHDNDTIALASGSTGMNVAKWDRYNSPYDLGSASSKGTGINWPLMRYSEVLLMLAEAENELNGPTELAKEMLTTVRARAFANSPTYAQDVTDYVNALTDKTAFFNAIVDERAWEFGGECIRKWDLQRWNNYGEKLNENIKAQMAWGIAMTPDLYNGLKDGSITTQYSELITEADKYLDWANKLYCYKPEGTKNADDLVWINSKYGMEEADVIARLPEGAKSFYSVDWGKKMLKSVTTYVYNGVEYTAKPVKSTDAETGVVTYELKKDNQTVTVTQNEDGTTDITKKMAYQRSDYATRIYRGYTGSGMYGEGAVPSYLPIGTTTISTSNVLNNDGYCFGYEDAGVNVEIGTVVTMYK